MLSLAIIVLWTSFACAYLIWQQLSGDLREQSAVSHQPSAEVAPRLRIFDAEG